MAGLFQTGGTAVIPAEQGDVSPSRIKVHTREEHALILDANMGERGLLRHEYRRCGFSGAGNCCCGRAQESPLHPHTFTLSQWGRERGRWICVCGKRDDHPSHAEAKSA